MKYLRLAIAFLTVFPVKIPERVEPEDNGRSAGWFPLIGGGMGGLVAAAAAGFRLVLPLPLAAVLSTAVWIALSGGLHLDGLTDSCDGLLNAASPERRLEIMKDPRMGTFGGIGLILTILVKCALIYCLPGTSLWFALPLAMAAGRWMLLPAGRQPAARPGGMGDAFSRGLNRQAWLPALLTVAALTVPGGWRGLTGVLLAHLTAWFLFRAARKRLGGITGDIFGLCVECTEMLVLTAFCVL